MTNSSSSIALKTHFDTSMSGGKSEGDNPAPTTDVPPASRAFLLHRVVFLPLDCGRQNITVEEFTARNGRSRK